MEQGRATRWEIVVIAIAIFVLAGSIFVAGVKVANVINANVKSLKVELKEELKKDLRKEVISFIYAYRSAAVENRQMSEEDLRKGYEFAEKFLSK